ncbi:MAG: c-type cytochrome [Gammaproteobacteria bacterium]|nr:c-type cytochrome [Gammaproteobacteria bacterium]
MATGDQVNGFNLYNAPSNAGGCAAGCHGVDGMKIDFDPPNNEFVDTITHDNPWEGLHKIRFGHPGAAPYMPGITEYDDPDLGYQAGVDILSYTQGGLVRHGITGGRLYDNWIIESGVDATLAVPNPLKQLAPDQAAIGLVSDVDSWRCSKCHGFDYEGGVFGFSNNLVELKSVNKWTFDYVFSVLKNGYSANIPGLGVTRVHDYGNKMTDHQLWNLADFAVNEIFDTHTYIRAQTGGIREPQGDAVEGNEIYNGLIEAAFPDGRAFDCISCHGADGKLATELDGTPIDLFEMAWTMPWEFFHRTKFGSPRLPTAITGIMPGVLEATRTDGHKHGNHDVANVQLFSQQSLNAIAPARVNQIVQTRERDNQ